MAALFNGFVVHATWEGGEGEGGEGGRGGTTTFAVELLTGLRQHWNQIPAIGCMHDCWRGCSNVPAILPCVEYNHLQTASAAAGILLLLLLQVPTGACHDAQGMSCTAAAVIAKVVGRGGQGAADIAAEFLLEATLGLAAAHLAVMKMQMQSAPLQCLHRP